MIRTSLALTFALSMGGGLLLAPTAICQPRLRPAKSPVHREPEALPPGVVVLRSVQRADGTHQKTLRQTSGFNGFHRTETVEVIEASDGTTQIVSRHFKERMPNGVTYEQHTDGAGKPIDGRVRTLTLRNGTIRKDWLDHTTWEFRPGANDHPLLATASNLAMRIAAIARSDEFVSRTLADRPVTMHVTFAGRALQFPIYEFTSAEAVESLLMAAARQ